MRCCDTVRLGIGLQQESIVSCCYPKLRENRCMTIHLLNENWKKCIDSDSFIPAQLLQTEKIQKINIFTHLTQTFYRQLLPQLKLQRFAHGISSENREESESYSRVISRLYDCVFHVGRVSLSLHTRRLCQSVLSSESNNGFMLQRQQLSNPKMQVSLPVMRCE